MIGGNKLYLGARKLTTVNAVINISFYIFLSWIFDIQKNIFSTVFLGVALVFYYIFNIYNLEKGRINLNDFVDGVIINGALSVFSFRIIPIRESFEFFTFVFIFQNLSKIVMYYFFVKDRNVMIIGSGNEAREIKEILQTKQMYSIVAELPIDDYKKIEDIVDQRKVSKLIITENFQNRSFIENILSLKLKGIQVFDYLSFFEKVEEKVPVKAIDEEWILYGSGFSILYDGIQGRIKRLFDLFCAIVIGLTTLPIMMISVLIIKLESKGGVLYSQNRVGLGNKEFKIYKFRSMKEDAEKDGAKWAVKNDPRVTKFGNFMRKTRIDELPQLWNVIKGEMTFVGPRPERMVFIKELEKEIPFYNIRHCVKPGLTGWAQVMYPYGASVEDAHQKLQYDLYYVKHQTLALDLMILFRTVKTVVFGRGR